jgi:hypothetical protein
MGVPKTPSKPHSCSARESVIEAEGREAMRQRPHPLGRLIDGALELRGWAVLMHEGGYETPHLHPSGLQSVVYYAAVPEVVQRLDDVAGNLCFGVPEGRQGYKVAINACGLLAVDVAEALDREPLALESRRLAGAAHGVTLAASVLAPTSPQGLQGAANHGPWAVLELGPARVILL